MSKVRTLVVPEDIFPFARQQCAACMGTGKFTARKNLPNGKLDELLEHLCPCAIKRFLDRSPNVDIDLSSSNAGAMYFVTESATPPPENPEPGEGDGFESDQAPKPMTAKDLIDAEYTEFEPIGVQR